MKNESLWEPTKFVKNKNSFKVIPDLSKIALSSRLIGDIQAKNYYNLIKNHASGILLDLGCGNVALYEMYKPFVNKIFCADWPNTLHNILFVDFKIDLNKSFPLRENVFDTVLLTDVLEHIANPSIAWNEIARILKPGGKLILTVPFIYLLHEEPYDYFRYTEFRLKRYCEENNLTIKELYPYGGSVEVFFDFLSKHLSFSNIFGRINNWIGKILINSFLGKKIYSLTASKYPLGYCLIAQK